MHYTCIVEYARKLACARLWKESAEELRASADVHVYIIYIICIYISYRSYIYIVCVCVRVCERER
jgi:hypothetical protein